jgi:TPR repeat protein
MNFNGDGRPKDWETAYRHLEQACRLKDGDGCGYLGYAQVYGKGVDKDEKSGYENAVLGCRKNSGYSCYLVGILNEFAIGTPPNSALALVAHEKACDLEYNKSCNSFVALTLNLKHVSREQGGKILKLSRAGCQAGNAGDCNNLGIIHVRGHGLVRASTPLGITYFREGCRLGSENACQNLRKLQ